MQRKDAFAGAKARATLMKMANDQSPAVTQTDRDLLLPLLARLQKPETLPFSFDIGVRHIEGIPVSFQPNTTREEKQNADVYHTTGTDPETGLEVTFTLTVYRDFPAAEWLIWLKNTGKTNTPLIRNLYAGQLLLPSEGKAVLTHDNGDGRGTEGYTDTDIPLEPGVRHTFSPCGGRPTSEDFPYFTVSAGEIGYKLVVGWSGQWLAHVTGTENGVLFDAKQYQTNFWLKPEEAVRTPIVLVVAYTGDYARGVNMWRRFYGAHIMPHFYEGFPEPLLFCHQADRPGSEWAQATGDGQVEMIRRFLARGMKFNGWWIDAGWYTCDGDWGMTGNWYPDPERFPQGLKPIGDICAANNIKFLLWFEPERTRMPSKDKAWKNDWLLDWVRIEGNGKEEISEQYLYDLGNPEAREWMTERVCAVLRESGVNIFRSDFNILPWGHWTCRDTWDRRGITENHYVQGYLKFWKDIMAHNPGIIMDSCASGGGRNDLETMRMAVPLQFTDCGIGCTEPFKTAFSYTMYQWIPYFRQHAGAWDGALDNYLLHCAICPSITYLLPNDAPEEAVQYSIRMDPVVRKAADMMIRNDYYPLAPNDREPGAFYCVQFHDEKNDSGLIQAIRHPGSADGVRTVFPHALSADKTYVFESPEFGTTAEYKGDALIRDGFAVDIPDRSGNIWFYHAK